MSLRPSIVIVTLMVSLLAGCSDMAFRKHDEPMIDNTPPTPAPKISTVDDEKPIKIKTNDEAQRAKAKSRKAPAVRQRSGREAAAAERGRDAGRRLDLVQFREHADPGRRAERSSARCCTRTTRSRRTSPAT